MSRPLAEVRREAEEALATVAQRYPNGWGSYDTLSICTSALRALLAETARETDAPRARLCACAWCGGALVQDPDALHRWRCINAEQRKCVARGDWYILDDDRDYIPVYPATAPAPCDGHGETYDEVWRDRERLRERVAELEEDLIDIPDVAR